MARQRHSHGFTLVEIMIVVAIIGVLISIALPAFIGARQRSKKKACFENQSKMDYATQEYYVQFGAVVTPPIESLIGKELYLQSTPVCPESMNYIEVPDSGFYAVCPDEADTHHARDLN